MQKYLAIFLAFLGWFALITQYLIMVDGRVAGIGETTIRFFSYFTILTNSIVTHYFTRQALGISTRFNLPGSLTAITVYITVVGLVYQVMLRQLWSPTGLARLVDELLHTIIPILTIIYWFRFENHTKTKWKFILGWMIYPIVYFFYILFAGHFSRFYPYPFVNVIELGLLNVLMNALLLFFVFGGFSALFIALGKKIK